MIDQGHGESSTGTQDRVNPWDESHAPAAPQDAEVVVAPVLAADARGRIAHRDQPVAAEAEEQDRVPFARRPAVALGVDARDAGAAGNARREDRGTVVQRSQAVELALDDLHVP